MLVGTRIKEALESVGMDETVVTRWLGRPCGCRERQRKLDALGLWVGRVVSGKIGLARKYLQRIIEREQD